MLDKAVSVKTRNLNIYVYLWIYVSVCSSILSAYIALCPCCM